MKKSDSIDLTQPTRQSYTAILIIMYRLYKLLIRQLFPIILIVLLQGKLASSPWFIYGIITIASLASLYSIVAFFKYYFFIKNQKLIVNKGVFKNSVLEIPFDRIQSINFEQNLIHRIFKVVKLNIDTAGSAGNEIQLYALDQNLANELSEIILRNKKKSTTDEGVMDETPDERKIIFRLSLPQLIKVGITENHIRSGGVIIFFFFYIYDSLKDLGINVIEKSEQYAPMAEQLAQSLTLMALFVIFFAIVAFVISLVRTILNHYDLKMYRKANGFVVVSGLLNKKERAAKDDKVQIIKSSQNLLQRLSGIHELVIKQASSAIVSDVKSIKVVGLSGMDVSDTYRYVLKSSFKGLAQLNMKKVEFYYLFKKLYYSSLLFLPLILISGYNHRIDLLIYAFALYIIALIGSRLAYRKKRYGIGTSLVKIEGGVFGFNNQIVENYKIQSLKIKASFFQRRRGLCTLIIYTASGSMKIPDINEASALKAKKFLLYKIESSRKAWM